MLMFTGTVIIKNENKKDILNKINQKICKVKFDIYTFFFSPADRPTYKKYMISLLFKNIPLSDIVAEKLTFLYFYISAF